MDTYRSTIFGICSFIPLILFLIYTFDLFGGMIDEPTTVASTLFMMALSVGALVAIALLIYELVHAFFHPELSLPARIVWIIALAIAGPFSIPTYWMMHLREPVPHHPIESRWY